MAMGNGTGGRIVIKHGAFQAAFGERTQEGAVVSPTFAGSLGGGVTERADMSATVADRRGGGDTAPPSDFTPYVGGVPFRMCLYFAANPHEELLASDVEKKWGRHAPRNYRDGAYFRSGWITKEFRSVNARRCAVFRAGPALLESVGLCRTADGSLGFLTLGRDVLTTADRLPSLSPRVAA